MLVADDSSERVGCQFLPLRGVNYLLTTLGITRRL